MASVQQLRSRIGQLHQNIRELEAQLPEAELRETGLKIGDVVYETSIAGHSTGRVGTIHGVRCSWAMVKLHRKDGSLGQREATFFNWNKRS